MLPIILQFKNKRANQVLHFFSFLTIGIDPQLWGLRHLRSHHLYANVEGSDIDIDTESVHTPCEFKDTIDASPTFSVIGSIALDHHWRIDPTLTFFIPQSKNTVAIKGDEGVVQGK